MDFVDNYDSTMKEPTLLPATFPSVLVNANTGIAVGMASNICPFNLAEVCRTTIALLRDPEADIFATMQGPGFPRRRPDTLRPRPDGEHLQDRPGQLPGCAAAIPTTSPQNCIDVTQIPPTTTIEVIVERVIDLVKQGKLKEIGDIRDETGMDGLKITIDLKRGSDPDKLMQKLFKLTTLEDSFASQLHVLIAGTPRVLGVRELLRSGPPSGGVRPPPHPLRPGEEAGEAPPPAGPGADSAGHRQGHPHVRETEERPRWCPT